MKVVHSNCTDKTSDFSPLFHTIVLWLQDYNVWIWNPQQIVYDWLDICYCSLEIEIRYQSGYRVFDGSLMDRARYPLTHLRFWKLAKPLNCRLCIAPDPEKKIIWLHLAISTIPYSQRLKTICYDGHRKNSFELKLKATFTWERT